MRSFIFFCIILLVSTTAQASGSSEIELRSDRQSADTQDVLVRQARAVFGLLPQRMPGSERDTPELIALGEMLYFAPELSINKTQSCNTCHPIDGKRSGADNLSYSPGALGIIGTRNAPTVLNAGFQISLFWDGRAHDLAEQAKGPILNAVEMGMPHVDFCLKRMKRLGRIERAFRAAYPGQAEPVTYENLASSIAAFERTLVSRGRFDLFLEGNTDAITDREKTGLSLFMNKGCIRCHNGPLLGGMLYQKLGLYGSYRNTGDTGRFALTKDENDRYVFKVSSLRNVTLTAPYFHDGRVATLAEAVDEMARLELGITLESTEIDAILRFLTTLADVDRTTVPVKPSIKPTGWNPPKREAIPSGEQGDLIRYGQQLLTRTQAYLGLGAKTPAMIYTRCNLACGNCHQEGGTKMFGIPWMGVIGRYPQFSSRTNGEVTLDGRINDCMERSMNGRGLPQDSREMQAIIAYFAWLSTELKPELQGLLKVKLTVPDRSADRTAGAMLYREYCQACHGADGAGYRARSSAVDGVFVTPPVWGAGSFNTGAGMHRILMTSAFIRGNMPLGTPWDRPVLTDGQAYDIAAYINSFERPVLPNEARDWPDVTKKPVDCPYPPYADNFSREQHKYGPFEPIRAAKKKAPEHR